MLFDEVMKNPFVKRAVVAGEERMGKVVGRLLADERVSAGLSALLSSASHARERLDVLGRGEVDGVERLLDPAIEALRRKLDDLEATIDGLAEKVTRGRGGRGPA